MLPDVATVAETVPGYEASGWYGLCAPKGIPASVLDTWGRETMRIMRTEEVRKRMETDAIEVIASAPAPFLDVIRRDIEKWRKVVREAKITVN